MQIVAFKYEFSQSQYQYEYVTLVFVSSTARSSSLMIIMKPLITLTNHLITLINLHGIIIMRGG